ncbi:MAG TPA: 2-phospho-L-lactate guanylyltransferase [Anaerolineales bacterium]|jgi:2-phospho-L-lactate guanylyltransferase|nr:2-phospho-L-lactate guanylyltransferase [Anaerolineales bacterium]
MTLWAIVPVKPLRRGKSRLASALSEDERTELNRSLLQNTLKTFAEVREVEEVLVISRDPQVLAIARQYGARTVREDGQPGLNTALKRATVIAQVYATRGVLILPADLPLVTREDVLTLIERAGEAPTVVIAPDRHGTGTNALLVSPAGLIEYDFGENSFQSHCQRAQEAGARVEIVNLPTLGLDLDLPEDLELVRKFELVRTP